MNNRRNFNPGHWAAAFAGSIENRGVNPADGFEALQVLASWAASLPGAASGSSAAEKMETLIREGTAKTGTASAAMETAARFIVLMTRKNTIRHIGAVVDEIKKIQDRKNGIVQVSAEYAFPPADDFESLVKNAIAKKTGASGVMLRGRINTELIGGYRLRIGDELIDASVRTQLMKLEACLAAAATGMEGPSADGGN